MPTINHLFYRHIRYENGKITSIDDVNRLAILEYNNTGDEVIIRIVPTLSPKRAVLYKQDGFTLYYKGEDLDYRFIIECWEDNRTIKRLSVIRIDTGVEIMYISTHQKTI